MTSPLSMREAKVDDLKFILNSWVESHREAPGCEHVKRGAFRVGMSERVKRLLKRCGATVAYEESTPAQIWGWVCAERLDGALVVHYCYVKSIYRRLGVAGMLMGELGYERDEQIIATHVTRPFAQKRLGHYRVICDPFLLERLHAGAT